MNASLRNSPTRLGSAARKEISTALQQHAPRLAHFLKGDLLPLPLGMSAEDLAASYRLLKDKALRDENPTLVVELGIAAWLDSAVVVLNSIRHVPQAATVRDDGIPHWPGLSNQKPRPNHKRVLSLLKSQSEAFVIDENSAPVITESMDWCEALRKKRYNYSGHLVSESTAFTWAQVEPAMPPIGTAARINVPSLCEGMSLKLLAQMRAHGIALLATIATFSPLARLL